jgi:hypothetical protein
MKRFVAGFSNWSKLNENEEEDFDTKLGHIRRLVDLGLIPASEIKRELRSQKTSSVLSSDDIYREILASPEYQELKEIGLEIVSTPTQLKNRTLVIGFPDYNRDDRYAIAFFPEARKIKRITPKKTIRGPWGNYLSLDFRIKEFPKGLFKDDLEFYLKGMRWVVDHIDFETPSSDTGTPEFKVKKRTPRGYFD